MSINAGTRLGSYEIVAPLGAGGMGEVYRARDVQLEREVAIKVLGNPSGSLAVAPQLGNPSGSLAVAPQLRSLAADPERLARFEREAKALAALNHPNVATLHGFERDDDSGTSFLVMELVEGEDLADRLRRGPIPIDEAIPIFVQIARGLEAAHERGIVHRDLKPGNVKLAAAAPGAEPTVKILDFGLAKATEPGAASAADLSQSPTMTLAATRQGEILGTAAYMSPEQAQGRPVDPRSDVWSFGVCLLETLSGRRTFGGENASMVLASVLKDEPSLDVLPEETPASVRRLLRRCLTRDLSKRLQAIGDARVELEDALSPSEEEGRRRPRLDWRVALVLIAAIVVVLAVLVPPLLRPAAEAIDSLVVLPLENSSEDADAEYLGDGIAENLINQLAGREGLRVIARSTAFRFRDSDQTPQELGRQLDVKALLSGRVQRRDDEINVQVDLVDAEDGSQLWGAQFGGSAHDLVALQQTITRQVLERLRPELSPAETVVDLGTSNPEAYDRQLRASHQFHRGTRESIQSAIDDYRRATELDPDYAVGWAGLAISYGDLSSFGFVPPSSIIDSWKEAAERAIELDDSLPLAWRARAYLAYAYEWDWEGAEAMFERVVALDPSSGETRAASALFFSLFDPARGIEVARQAVELEPTSLYANRILGIALSQDRRYDEAIAQYQRTLRLDPTYLPALEGLAGSYQLARQPQKAMEVLQRALKAGSLSIHQRSRLERASVLAGDRTPAEELLAEVRDGGVEYLPSASLAELHLVLGDPERALDRLEIALEEREWLLVWLNMYARWDPLRGEPRFQRILDRIGFPEPAG